MALDGEGNQKQYCINNAGRIRLEDSNLLVSYGMATIE
jgi:hypothetical protein